MSTDYKGLQTGQYLWIFLAYGLWTTLNLLYPEILSIFSKCIRLNWYSRWWTYTMWGPLVVSWFLHPMNTTDISSINHTEPSYKANERYQTGPPTLDLNGPSKTSVLNRVFHQINHPAIGGTPISGNSHIYTYTSIFVNTYIYIYVFYLYIYIFIYMYVCIYIYTFVFLNIEVR